MGELQEKGRSRKVGVGKVGVGKVGVGKVGVGKVGVGKVGDEIRRVHRKLQSKLSQPAAKKAGARNS